MAIRYDPLLVQALRCDIMDRWGGCRVSGLHMDRSRRAMVMTFEGRPSLVTLLHPALGWIFPWDGEVKDLGLQTKSVKIGRLSLGGVETTPDERTLLLVLSDRGGRPWQAVGMTLRPNGMNAFVCRKGEVEDHSETSEPWHIEVVLHTRTGSGARLLPGRPYELPYSNRRAAKAFADQTEWLASFSDDPSKWRGHLLRNWAWTSSLNVDWILSADGDLKWPRYQALQTTAANLRDTSKTPPCFPLDRSWGTQPYPLALECERLAEGGVLVFSANAVEKMGGPAAILGEIRQDPTVQPEDDLEWVRRQLRHKQGRAKKRLRALKRELEGRGKPEDARLFGSILLSYGREIPKGVKEIRLPDFEGRECVIPLDPAKTAMENAEHYFEEARRRQRAQDELPRRLEQTRGEIVKMATLIESIDDSGPTAEMWDIVGERPIASRKNKAPRLPYTVLRSSGGLEIRVGRGAADNDALTFRHTAPEDIWLHASQAAGAHVILRWGQRAQNPPRRDLVEAATVAAVKSGARHSKMASIVWTRRKYVRKPRKSPPGTVVPDRVQTMFVKPDAELVDRLGAG